jgi:dihydroxyacetone kinase-like protein
MIDALSPALEAMRQAQSTQADITEMLRLGTLAAEEGMKHTIPLQAKKGRASYLGERSIGHQDPGRHLLFPAAADCVRDLVDNRSR